MQEAFLAEEEDYSGGKWGSGSHYIATHVMDDHTFHSEHPRLDWILRQGKKGWLWALLLTLIGENQSMQCQ